MILDFENNSPRIHPSCFLAPQSVVIGDVEMGEDSSLWFQSVLRGDVNSIRIGKKTNIQDLCMVHVTNRDAPRPSATIIGDEVTIGHHVVIHGCTIGNRCLIGMGSVIMDGVVIGEASVVGASSLITEGKQIPPGSLVMGSPAKVVRTLTDGERALLELSAFHYSKLAKKYLLQGIGIAP